MYYQIENDKKIYKLLEGVLANIYIKYTIDIFYSLYEEKRKENNLQIWEKQQALLSKENKS